MAKNKNRLGNTPIVPGQTKPDDWKDDEVEAEAEAEAWSEDEAPKESLFDKAKHVVHQALHIDEPKPAPIAQPQRGEDPRKIERVGQPSLPATLENDGAKLKALPINKVPGKLRKFVTNN
jgi:hypothetical protein